MPDEQEKPDSEQPDKLEDLSEVPEMPDEEVERIINSIEDDMERKGFGADPVPRPSALPVRSCAKGPGGKHQWRLFHNFKNPLTNAPMHKFICNHCQQQTSVPLGQQPPP